MTGMVYSYRSQTKLRKGNVFTRVCDSVHREGVSVQGGSLSRGVSVQWVSVQGGLCPGGVSVWGGSVRETPSATIWLHVGGMHPTGMHSCYRCVCLFMGISTGVSTHPLGEFPPPSPDTWDTTGYGQQAGGTHSTRMLSCFCWGMGFSLYTV